MTGHGPEVGLDVGATLAKIVLEPSGGAQGPTFELLPSADPAAVADHVSALGPSRVGATGGGAVGLLALLADRLDAPGHHAGEFEAWGAGARRLLTRAEGAPPAGEPFLVVSLGTGTSILLVTPETTLRVGGTALGGGAVVGLGGTLAGADFDELCELARQGDAGGVDLRVSDIYTDHEISLAGDLTAASFGKLARDLVEQGFTRKTSPQDRADRVAGVMRLVGENVALICAGIAAATRARHVVYGGSTLHGNSCLVEVLREVTALCGLQCCFLPHGGFAGALGALELARRAAGVGEGNR